MTESCFVKLSKYFLLFTNLIVFVSIKSITLCSLWVLLHPHFCMLQDIKRCCDGRLHLGAGGQTILPPAARHGSGGRASNEGLRWFYYLGEGQPKQSDQLLSDPKKHFVCEVYFCQKKYIFFTLKEVQIAQKTHFPSKLYMNYPIFDQ